MVRMRTISNQSRHDEREPRTDISQVELQLHGLRNAPRWGLHQLRREDRGADPGVRPQRARRRAVLGRLPRGDRAVLLHPARALARAAHAMSAATSASRRRGHFRAARSPGLEQSAKLMRLRSQFLADEMRFIGGCGTVFCSPVAGNRFRDFAWPIPERS
jgi:hypothetical protein